MLRRLALSAVLALALAPAARADQRGEGPVRAQRVVDSHHVTFVLAGSGWKQIVGLTGGTPSVGGFQVQQPDYSWVALYVSARAQGLRPVRRGRTVRLSGTTLRVSRAGTNGPVHWFAGTRTDGTPFALGYQRAPRSLSKRWLVYTVRLNPELGTTTGPYTVPAVRTAARTMRLGTGAAQTPDVPPTIER